MYKTKMQNNTCSYHKNVLYYLGIKNHGEKVSTVNVILEIIVIGIAAVFVYSGFRRGILYMAINLAGTVISIAAAVFLSSVFAPVIYNSFIKDNVISGIASSTEGISLEEPAKAAEQTLDSVSDFSGNALSYLGVNKASLTEKFAKTTYGLPETVEEIIRPGGIKVVACVMTVIIFIILMVISAFIANKFTKDINKTILGIPNKLAGAAVGFVQAVLIVMILDVILFFVMMLVSQSGYDGLNESMNNTIFFKMLTAYNIPDRLLTLFSSL